MQRGEQKQPMKTHQQLEDLSACQQAVAFAAGYDNLQDAWTACPRGDWLLWFAARRNVNRQTLVLAACACARLVLPYTKDRWVLACIETTEAWCRGEVSLEEVQKARAATAVYCAAYSAATAATYASAAATAATAAVYCAAYSAATDAAATDATAKTRLETANIVRSFFPTLP